MAKGITAQEMDSATASGLVPHLGTTTNSGNSYSVISNTPISTNQKFTIKFNVASSTAPTLKINNDTALPIKNANSNNAKLYASVYTLFRDGSAFILQGEGGGGNVKPDQVEAGFTFTNDDGDQVGTLSKQAFVDQLIAKGVSASMSDPFNTLSAKIGEIGIQIATGRVPDTGGTIANLPFKPMIVIFHIINRNTNSYNDQLNVSGYIGSYLNDQSVVNFSSMQGSYFGTSPSISTHAIISSANFGNNSINVVIARSAYSSQGDVSYTVFGV